MGWRKQIISLTILPDFILQPIINYIKETIKLKMGLWQCAELGTK